MEKSKNKKTKQKKLSRKEISTMTRAELLTLTKDLYIRMFQYIKRYKHRFYLGIFFSIAYGFFQGFMMFCLKIIIGIVLPGSVENFAFPGKELLKKWGLDTDGFFNTISSGDSSLQLVVCAALSIPLLFLIRGGLQYLSNYCMIWVGTKVLYDVRSDVFANLIRQSNEFFSSSKTGQLIQTVFNQTRLASSTTMSLIMDLIKRPVSILTIVAYLFWEDWLFAVCALVVFPLSLLPVIHISRKVRKAGGKEELEAGNLIAIMHEAFTGIRVVKSHAREEFELKRFNIANLAMAQFIMRWRKALEIVGPMMETIASIGIGSAFIYAWHANIGAGQFMLMCMALIAIYPHAKSLSQMNVLLQKCLVAISSVFEFIDKTPDIDDAPDAVNPKEIKGKIEFKDVTFSYKKDKENSAVKNINITFEDGKSYALVGSTGAGKTTMFSLILRFYDVDSGQILLDGIDIRKLKQQTLRDNIGMVNQDVFLFHDTIFNNILYGKLDAKKKDIQTAARQAFAEEFIMDGKTGGYQSVIGEGGSKLSGGQKQRLTIARAILRDAPILLLDEATSSVDSETERKIKVAIDKLSKGKTTIAIAHRLSTVLNADQIIYMKHGEIKETGTHEELLKKSEGYKKLYELQFK